MPQHNALRPFDQSACQRHAGMRDFGVSAEICGEESQTMPMRRIVSALLLPGLTFQGVLIGGGYATGRELIEFFLRYGPRAAILGALLSMVLMSIVLAYTFEFARMTRCYDYNSFFEQLLGPCRFVFEVAFLALNTLVLAVTSAAAGALLAESFGVPAWAGTFLLCVVTAIFLYLGGRAVERLFLYWSPLLILTYVIFLGVALVRFDSEIANSFAAHSTVGGAAWIVGAIAYTGYNVVIGPAVLFSLNHVETRAQALWSGVLAGPIAMLPALFFIAALVALYPAVVDAAIPSERLLAALHTPILRALFLIAVFGTLVQTAVGVTKAISDRLELAIGERRGRPVLAGGRLLIGLGLLGGSIVVAQGVGLVDLIGRGYGTLAWVFVAVYIVPILTFGAWRVHKRSGARASVTGVSAIEARGK
ncbi:MAG: YkvI family membrane protein [Steroidobacteraceae bacterium]